MDEVVETSDPEELELELRANPIRQQSPRKRVKLHHEYTDISPGPPRSPSSSSNAAASEFASPASLTRASSPKTSSPIATPPVSTVSSSVSPPVANPVEEDLFASQDPLLLAPKFRVVPENDELPPPQQDYNDRASPMRIEPNPPRTPSTQRSRLPADPSDLFSPTPPSLNDERVDTSTPGVQLHASPVPASTRSSPLTSPPAEQRNTPRRDSPVFGQPSPSPQTGGDRDMALALAQPESGRRYPLRHREERQVRPYRHDDILYKNAMRRHPEAIVHNPLHTRHRVRGDDYEDEQTQANELVERGRGRSPRATLPEDPWVEKNLPPAPPSGDDSDEGMDQLRREGAEKSLEGNKGERKVGKPIRKKARPFPLAANGSDNENSRDSPKARRKGGMTNPTIGRASQNSFHPPRRTSGSSISPEPAQAIPRPITPVFANARAASPPALFPDDSDFAMEMPGHGSLPPSPHVQHNDRDSPIVITDEEDEDGEASGNAEESEPEILSKEEKKNRRRLHALNRMYPAFMREKMMKDAPAKATGKRKRSLSLADESEEEQPLQPGKTRTRRAENPRDIRDIKGDTESSEDEALVARNVRHSDDDPASSDSDVEVVWHRQSHRHRRREGVREDVWESSDDEPLPDERIDDERIEIYLQEADVHGSGLHEKDMIDWMLDNTVEVGGTRKPTIQTKSNNPTSKRRSGTKLSITVGGARSKRQRLLPFHKSDGSRDVRPAEPRSSSTRAAPSALRDSRRLKVHQTVLVLDENPPPRRHSQPRRRSSYSSPERASAPSGEGVLLSPPPYIARANETVHNIPDAEMTRKAAKKLQEKEKRARMKQNGVYLLRAPKGSRIVGQHSKTVAIKADGTFHQGLAPKSDKRRDDRHPKARPQPVRPPRPKAGRVASTSGSGVSANRRLLPRGDRPPVTDPVNAKPGTRQEDSDDAAANPPDAEPEEEAQELSFLLDFGVPLRPDVTFSAQSTYIGKGYLSELVNLPAEAARPQFFSAHGFDLGPNVPLHEFLNILEGVCDRFLDFATGLPEDDSAEQAKEWAGLIHVTCHLVSYLTANEAADALKTAIETQVLRLTSNLREAALTSESMDSTTFSICWFAVELAIRAGFTLPPQGAHPLESPNALQEACAVLIEYLLEYGLERGMQPLITPGDVDDSTTAHRALEVWIGLWHVIHKYRHPTSTTHPLWKMVQTALVARPSSDALDLDGSEYVWRAIISISAVSQFSEMGKVTTSATIPRAGWEIVLFALQRIRLEADEQVDKTISPSSLEALGRYIRLVVERCCLLWSRWDWGLNDAFSVLHRLADIFRSRKFANLPNEKAEFPDFLRLNDWTLLSRRIHSETTFVLFLKLVYQTLLVNTSQVKKLLSVSAPLGSLPWSKETPRASLDELSMLFNRFTFTAIAIHIDPKHHANSIQRARGCVKFKNVDPTTRTAHIRGLMYLSVVMVQRNIPLDESISWLDEMVGVLLEEYKRRPDPSVVLGIHALVVAVRNIIRAFKGNPPETPHRYPDPRLILSLERILRDSFLVKPNNASAHIVPRLIRSFLTARALAVPEPRRPIHDIIESQDDYGALDDFNDAFIAALDEGDVPEYKKKDASLCKLLMQLTWTLFRQIGTYSKYKKLRKSFRDNNRVGIDMASLIACWLGCGNIVVHNGKNQSWSAFLHCYLHHEWTHLDDFTRRRMNFIVYSEVLKLDPMSYLTLQDDLLKVLFESLVSWHTTSEDEYIELLLSIDGGKHPLLSDVSWNREVAKDAPPIDLLTARLPLITAILDNIRQNLADPGGSDNGTYLGYCTTMFFAMKDIHLELDKSGAAEGYGAWCLQVYRELEKHSVWAKEARLEQWIAWGKRLSGVHQ